MVTPKDTKKKIRYIVVTPAKNEEKNLPVVIESLQSSTLKPALWVIVDDNSTDNTSDIIREKSLKYNNIVYVKYPYPSNDYDLFNHYSEVCKYGFLYAINLARVKGIRWDFIMLLDADTVVPENYVEDIIKKMLEYNTHIASGDVCTKNKKGEILCANLKNPLPSGTGRMWSRRAFYYTGGYPITVAPDTISSLRALKLGLKVMRFNELRVYQLRDTSSRLGSVVKYLYYGKRDGVLLKPLLLAFIYSGYLFVASKNPFAPMLYLFGYLKQILKGNNSKFYYLREYWSARLSRILGMIKGG